MQKNRYSQVCLFCGEKPVACICGITGRKESALEALKYCDHNLDQDNRSKWNIKKLMERILQ